MTTGPKRSLYWYIALLGTVILFPMSIVSLIILKQHAVEGTFWENWKSLIGAMVVVALNAAFFSDLFKYKEGYTIIKTTEYKLFKCRESGKDEAFMMFADREEELEKFFEITQPSKKFFIEPAEMTGKSIQMKIFNRANEN